jgi:hypothetical protein
MDMRKDYTMPRNEVKTESTVREVLPISPRSVTIDLITHSRRYVIVQLDPAITLDDIGNKPELWRLVQQDRNKALGPNDLLEIRGEGWICEARVNEIDSGKVYPLPFGGKTFANVDAAKRFVAEQYPVRVA